MIKKVSGDSTIAAWKIDSDEERRLALLADWDEDAKRRYVEFYRDNDPEYFEKGLGMIDKMIHIFRPDATQTEQENYVYDMVYSLHRFGCMFDEYFLLGFELLNARGRERFLTDKNRWEYYNKLNSPEGRALFNDKSKTYERFHTYYKRDLLCVACGSDYPAFCEFRAKHQSFIVKPVMGSGGKGIYIEKSPDEGDREVFARIRACGTVVIEELLKQIPEMEALHPGSLNTVRIPTITVRNRVVVFHPFLRIGIGEAVVDNAASGGIIAPVDPDTGIVQIWGITEFGKKHIRHPDTGIVIPGFQIPHWDQAVALVTELAKVTPENHYVGWDCALTKSGWVMVEGNPQGQFVAQYVTKEGHRDELEQLMKQM